VISPPNSPLQPTPCRTLPFSFGLPPRGVQSPHGTFLQLFSLAFLGVAFTLFITVFSVTPIVCGLGPNIDLPWANTSERLTEVESNLTITVGAKGEVVFVGANLVPRRVLPAELAAVARHSSVARHVLVRADGKLPYGIVQDVLVAASRAGFTRISLVTFRGPALEALQKGGAV
jgi:biopolymer transport protein ExbD